MNNNKGISIISLVTTIVIIMILASVTIFYGFRKNNDKAEETKDVYDVYSLIDAVTNRALMHRINPTYYNYVGNTDFDSITAGDGVTYTAGKWYHINDSKDFSLLGLDNLVGDFLVNYDTGEVVSVSGIKYQGKVYYSLNELRTEMGGPTTTVLAQAEYDKEKQVNKPILIEGMVPVKYNGSDWIVTSTDDSEWYDYSKEKNAWANVMLKDELVVEGFASNDEVRRATLSDLIGKRVTTEGSCYVWIPRYTKLSSGSDIVFSNLLEDYTQGNYEVQEAFNATNTTTTIQLPGIWISKYEASLSE